MEVRGQKIWMFYVSLGTCCQTPFQKAALPLPHPRMKTKLGGGCQLLHAQSPGHRWSHRVFDLEATLEVSKADAYRRLTTELCHAERTSKLVLFHGSFDSCTVYGLGGSRFPAHPRPGTQPCSSVISQDQHCAGGLDVGDGDGTHWLG